MRVTIKAILGPYIYENLTQGLRKLARVNCLCQTPCYSKINRLGHQPQITREQHVCSCVAHMMNGLPPHTDNNWAIKIIKTSLQLNLVPILSRSLTLARWENLGVYLGKFLGI